MSREKITLDSHTLSGIIHMLIEHAYDVDDKEIDDVHDLASYASDLDYLQVQIVKDGNITHFGFIERTD